MAFDDEKLRLESRLIGLLNQLLGIFHFPVDNRYPHAHRNAYDLSVSRIAGQDQFVVLDMLPQPLRQGAGCRFGWPWAAWCRPVACRGG